MNNDKLLNECFDDLKKFIGLYPYDGFNPCKNDNYFGKSIMEKYDANLIKYVSEILNQKEKQLEKYKKELYKNL